MGLAIRLVLAPHGGFQGDIQIYRNWAIRLVSGPVSDFYASSRSADHLPGDLWFLWGVAHVYHLMSPGMNVRAPRFLFLLKLVPAIADAGIGLMIFLIAHRLGGTKAGLLGAALYMFNPASIFLTSFWGQWDSISAFFMIAGLWLLLRGSPEWSLPVFTYAALIKPQLGLLLVLSMLAWCSWVFRVRPGAVRRASNWKAHAWRLAAGALSSLAVFFAVDLPFNVGLPFLPTRWTIEQRMSYALNEYTSISANAFNLWGLFGKTSNNSAASDRSIFAAGVSYQHWGEILLAVAIVIACVLFWLRPTRAMALWAALALTFSVFMLPTRMHERYLLPAVVVAVLISAVAPHFRWIGIVLSATYFANVFYVYHYFNAFGFGSQGTPSDLIPLVVSSVNVFLLLVVFVSGFVLAFGTDRTELREPLRSEQSSPPLASVARANDVMLPEGQS